MNSPNGILDAYGRPVSAERVRLEKQTRFNPLRGWTPDVLVRQLEAYSRGEIAALAWVMEWLEKHDDIIATVAPKAKAAVSRHGYDVPIQEEVAPELKGMAQDQQGVLQKFFQTLETSDAVELEEQGGMRMFFQQVMDAYGKGFAAHHIIWRPSRTDLQANLVKVPTWFFEATEGRLKFLPAYSAQRGVELETLGGRDAWMVSKGRGVMLAGVLARMFKQLPLQDWLTYCDRHGMPAFLGKTSAQKGTPEWQEMASAVAGIGAEFGAVVNTGDVIDVLKLTGQGEVPYVKLIDRMDRAQVMLWRGGDLSTMSRENGTGSNPQQEATDELDADNACWVSETINRNLTKRVIAWHFGRKAPALAGIKLRTATRDDVTKDMEIAVRAREMGVRLSKPWFLGKFGVVEADEGEPALGEGTPNIERPASNIEAAAINSADDYQKLFTTSLAEALGVRSEVLSPIDDLIAGLQDGGMDDAAWLQFVEEAADSFPELFDPADTEALAADLEAAMGTAVLIGTRDQLREENSNRKGAKDAKGRGEETN